jgi:SAM-dependent methyltransferase
MVTESVSTRERIEIIPVQILNDQRGLAEELKRLARELGVQIGWHYLLDLTWIITHLGGKLKGTQYLDAGAGLGIMQCYLASHGAEVLSVDRQRRAGFVPLSFRTRYHVRGQRPQDVLTGHRLLRARVEDASGPTAKAVAFARALIGLLWNALPHQRHGTLVFYEQDLDNLTDVPDESMDRVVAVSALEHNAPDLLPMVVRELMRVLRPGGLLLATLGAAQDRDWYHEPSQGWNYTDRSLRSVFGFGGEVPSNYDRYADLLEALRDCAELRDNLSPLYLRSGNNGMPWGRWDPQYQPVGVLKVK